jgi:hypothetical protein
MYSSFHILREGKLPAATWIGKSKTWQIAVINPSKRVPTVRYYELADRTRTQPKSPETNRGTCNTMQGESGQAAEICWRPVTLPKPPHILLTRTIVMRLLLALMALTVSGTGRANNPWSSQQVRVLDGLS